MTLNVTVNGELRTLSGPLSVRAMLAVLGLDPKKIAVERNLEIVPRSTYDQVPVADGDKFEIVHFIGGGNAPAGAYPRG
jgi:thiazole synthase